MKIIQLINCIKMCKNKINQIFTMNNNSKNYNTSINNNTIL